MTTREAGPVNDSVSCLFLYATNMQKLELTPMLPPVRNMCCFVFEFVKCYVYFGDGITRHRQSTFKVEHLGFDCLIKEKRKKRVEIEDLEWVMTNEIAEAIPIYGKPLGTPTSS